MKRLFQKHDDVAGCELNPGHAVMIVVKAKLEYAFTFATTQLIEFLNLIFLF